MVNLVLSQQNILSLQIVSPVSCKHNPDKNYNKNISGDVKSSQEQTYSELNTPLVVEELQDPLKQFLKKWLWEEELAADAQTCPAKLIK